MLMKDKKMELKKKWGIFLLLNLMLWSIIPLLRLSLPMDTQEAIVWGKYSFLGTTKHPPFSGIIAYYFYLFFNHADGAMYLLSQLFVILGLFYIYKLACLFLDKQTAILASCLQLGIIYYNFSSVEFNVNVISLALWPMCSYYFWLAYQNNNLKNWIFFGVLCGINLLNKYTGALLLLSFAVFILSGKETIKILINYKAYLAVLCLLLVISPHIWWLAEHNFEMLNYILMRNTNSHMITSEWRHIIYPLKFAGAQILFSFAALLIYFIFYRISPKNINFEQSVEKKRFLIICGFLPFTVFIFISLIAGSPLKSMWGFPCLFLVGISLFYFWPIKINKEKASLLLSIMFGWSALFACVYGIQCLTTTSMRFRTDCPALVQILEQKWTDYTGSKKLEYVGSDVWFSNMFSLYAKHEVKPMIWLSPDNNPWFDASDFEEKGALVVTSNYSEYMTYKNKFGEKMTDPQTVKIAYTSLFGRIKERNLFYGFYQTKEMQNHAQ